MVEAELWKSKSTLETFSTSTLYHALDLPFILKDIPDVFTNFRKKTEKEANIRSTFEKPKAIKSPRMDQTSIPSLKELGFENCINDPRTAIHFKGGENEGLKRLNYYLFDSKAIENYKETRNGLVGQEYSSKFSAWLALGCLSAREIYHEIKKYELQFKENESTYWLIFELLWRDYFRFMMKKYRNQFFQQNGIKNTETVVKVHNPALFQKWINGNTGNDFIDANMLELKLTGFMSNRGRQNVASYFCNELQLDWRFGTSYFEQQLIDYDVSSNWGNWAYLAGVGNDPRANRMFNIEKQAND